MITKHFIYCPGISFHLFSTKQEMEDASKKILEDNYLCDYWSEEVINAFGGYGTIPETFLLRANMNLPNLSLEELEKLLTHKIEQVITDRVENYSGEDDDVWPYDPDWDYVCYYTLKESSNA